LSAASPQVPRPRIQSLSDLIFGLALSIGAIQLVGSLPTKPEDLTNDILYFGFSFLIIINVWIRYTTTTSVMPVESPTLVRANILLLFLVAIEPFLFDVLAARGLSSAVGSQASVYYGIDIGSMNLILAYFTHVLTLEEKNLIPRELIHRTKVARNLLLAAAAVFLVSDLPVFYDIIVAGTPLRIWLWVLTLPAIWLPRLLKGWS
jgi:uncharacterized membrane protein